MRCVICGSKRSNLKTGLCDECFEKLPRCLSANPRNLQKEWVSFFHPIEEFHKEEEREYWIRYGYVGLTTIGMLIEKKHVILFKDLCNFSIDFVPRKKMGKDQCKGDFVLSFELNGIPYIFKTLMLTCTVPVTIKNGLLYPKFPERMIQLSKYLRKGILQNELYNEKIQYERQDQVKPASEYEQALHYFNLNHRYCADELKQRYREMIKQCHPDQQGTSKLKAEDVNRYYDILKKSL